MYKNILTIIALLTLVLAGCGTTDQVKDPVSDQTEQADQEAPSENNEQQPATSEQTDDNEKPSEPSDDNKNNVENKNDDDKTIQYKVNGVEKSAQAAIEHSDNQHYSMHVLPEYTLTAEEPNNDVVYVTDQGEVFMRIQLLTGDIDWKALTENSTAQLESVSSNIQTISPPAGDFLKDATIMETTLDEDVVTIYLIKNHSVPLKLMIFTKKGADHKDAFLKMAETIVKD